MVTHEESGIAHADRVLHLEGGKLVAGGVSPAEE